MTSMSFDFVSEFYFSRALHLSEKKNTTSTTDSVGSTVTAATATDAVTCAGIFALLDSIQADYAQQAELGEDIARRLDLARRQGLLAINPDNESDSKEGSNESSDTANLDAEIIFPREILKTDATTSSIESLQKVKEEIENLVLNESTSPDDSNVESNTISISRSDWDGLLSSQLVSKNQDSAIYNTLELFACKQVEMEILAALNWVRQNPGRARERLLKDRKGKYKGKDFEAGPGRILVTKEGEGVLTESVGYLEKLEKAIRETVNSSSDLNQNQNVDKKLNSSNSAESNALKNYNNSDTTAITLDALLPPFPPYNPSLTEKNGLHPSPPIQPLSTLLPLPLLALSAEDHAADIGQHGLASHTSSDGVSGLADRISDRYGENSFRGRAGECLWYGQLQSVVRSPSDDSTISECGTGTVTVTPNSGLSCVLDLVVDDGVPSRGHRLGVFDPWWHYVGISVKKHKVFGFCAAIAFSHTYKVDLNLDLKSRISSAAPFPIKPATDLKVETQWGSSLGKCAACGEDLLGGQIIEMEDKPKPNLSNQNPVTGTKSTSSGSNFMAKAAAKANFKANPKTAPGGSRGATSSSTKLKFHKSCFACAHCSLPLSGKTYFFVPPPGISKTSRVLFCSTCHTTLFAADCALCGEKITGVCLKAAGKTWHPACFKCDECGVELASTSGKFSAQYKVINEGGDLKMCFGCVEKRNLAAAKQRPGSGPLTGAAASKAKSKVKAAPFGGPGAAFGGAGFGGPKKPNMEAAQRAVMGAGMSYGDLM